jgi:hypothetical protein
MCFTLTESYLNDKQGNKAKMVSILQKILQFTDLKFSCLPNKLDAKPKEIHITCPMFSEDLCFVIASLAQQPSFHMSCEHNLYSIKSWVVLKKHFLSIPVIVHE